jgi:hypothetical protein
MMLNGKAWMCPDTSLSTTFTPLQDATKLPLCKVIVECYRLSSVNIASRLDGPALGAASNRVAS